MTHRQFSAILFLLLFLVCSVMMQEQAKDSVFYGIFAISRLFAMLIAVIAAYPFIGRWGGK